MFDSIVSPQNFARAYSQTRTGSPKHKAGAIRFSYNETHNLERLRQELIRGEYWPEEYFKFSVYEPKERVIYAPRYRDKIAQHAVNSVLRDFYEPKFIHDSYAGMADCQRFARDACLRTNRIRFTNNQRFIIVRKPQ